MVYLVVCACIQAEEIYGVAVAQQNKESVSQAWAEGVTLLPPREAVLLMLAFLPGSSPVEITVKASTDAPVAVTGYGCPFAANVFSRVSAVRACALCGQRAETYWQLMSRKCFILMIPLR